MTGKGPSHSRTRPLRSSPQPLSAVCWQLYSLCCARTRFSQSPSHAPSAEVRILLLITAQTSDGIKVSLGTETLKAFSQYHCSAHINDETNWCSFCEKQWLPSTPLCKQLWGGCTFSLGFPVARVWCFQKALTFKQHGIWKQGGRTPCLIIIKKQADTPTQGHF